MNPAIKTLRAYFKSEEWRRACMDPQQPVISDQGIAHGAGDGFTIELDTKINMALHFEGMFNELAHQYMQYRKEQGLKIND